MRSFEIIEQLPGLRRYANTLLGIGALADFYVEEALELLLAAQVHSNGDTPRVAIFAFFDQVCDGEGPGAQASNVADGRRFYRLPLAERKALLLVGVERFSLAEASIVLRLPKEIVARSALVAREHLRAATALKALVIEDEPLVAMSIAQVIRHVGHEVCGVAGTREEALARDHLTRPNLIVADVQLNYGASGIQTVREILRRHRAQVIFVTAYADELVAKGDLRDSYVIVKPFTSHTLETAVRRITGRPV